MTDEIKEIKYISFVPSGKPDSIYCSFCYTDLATLPCTSYTTFPLGKNLEDFFPDIGEKANLSVLSCNECCKNILRKEFDKLKIEGHMSIFIQDV